MAEDVRDRLTEDRGASPAGAQRDSDTWAKSYRYLRTAMVALLLGLGAAVGYQTWRQGWHLLGSVSAYYYTPAQAIFVGALIGLGACMIALRGTNVVEDVFLNLGGMFAAVVAVVPTSRGEDYRTAVRACKEAAGPLLTQQASSDLDCPTVQALASATAANVKNNMFALLVVGALGFAATGFFAWRDSRSTRRVDSGRVAPADPDSRPNRSSRRVWWGFALAFVVWAAGGVAWWKSDEWLVDHAHYIAAAGLFVCILVVAVANALRHEGRRPAGATALRQTLNAVGAARGALIRSPRRLDPYAVLAWAMVAAAGITGALLFVHRISLFWLEIIVFLLFILFWTVQTIELADEPQRAAPRR
jgi:hypothetical protein